MRRLLKNSTLFILLVACCIACDKQRVFDVYKTVPNQWHKDSVVTFAITAPDTLKPYNLFVNLRNTNAYRYSNLFLIVEMRFPHGRIIKDTLEYRMAKPSGELLGSGIGDVKENKLWYKEGVVFKEAGTYNVAIQHAMRAHGEVKGVVNLEGITDVGFRLEKPVAVE